MRLRKVTLFIASFIIVSASFMRQALDLVRSSFGGVGVTVLLGFLAAAVSCAFLLFLIKKRPGVVRTVILILILMAGLALSWQLKIPAERIHMLEYGLLGVLAAKDLGRRRKGILLACLFCVTVGVIDEAFQLVLPYRVFDTRDIVLNGAGALWGIVLYLLF